MYPDPFKSFDNTSPFRTVARTGLMMTLVMGFISLTGIAMVVFGIVYCVKLLKEPSPPPAITAPATHP